MLPSAHSKTSKEVNFSPLTLYMQCKLRRSYFEKFDTERYNALLRLRDVESSSGYSFRPFIRKKCIFVHIPRCAGVSVCMALFGNLAGGHTTVKEYQAVFSPEEFLSFFKFTIVRNPWDRLVSAYYFLKGGGMNETDRLWANKNINKYRSFNDFVLQWVNRINIMQYYHFRPQSHFVCVGGRVAVDFIGRFETLENDFDFIASRLGIHNRLPLSNRSAHGDYRDLYDKKTKEIVADVYAEDIETFGYSF